MIEFIARNKINRSISYLSEAWKVFRGGEFVAVYIPLHGKKITEQT